MAYIYLLQDGCEKGSNIYKIGRTVQSQDTRKLARFQTYLKGTIIYNLFHVEYTQICEVEKKIKQAFKKKYIPVRGQEWFEGNVRDMKKEIDKIIDSFIQEEPKRIMPKESTTRTIMTCSKSNGKEHIMLA